MKFTEAFSLREQVAIITGGGTGIGFAMARSMHEAGARVVLIGRREAELLAAVKQLGPRASHVVHDITQLDAAPALAERVTQEVGPVSILVNNAAIHLKKPAVDTTSDEFEQVLAPIFMERTH